MGEATYKGYDDCGHDECGGPWRGLAFPEYQGPLKSNLELYCFRCGRDGDLIIEVSDDVSDARLGFCKLCQEELPDRPIELGGDGDKHA